jgi:signal transduction histidine kinase
MVAQSDLPLGRDAVGDSSSGSDGFADVRYFDEGDERGAAGLLGTILDTVMQGIALFDADFNLVLFNRAYPELFDYGPDFLRLGMNYEEILRFNAARRERGDYNPERYVEDRMAVVRARTPFRREHVRPTGKVLAIRFTPIPRGGFIHTYTDITERKRAEDDAARTSAILKATLENMADGVRVFDKDLRLIAWNEKSLEMFDYPPELGKVGTPYQDFVNINVERGEYGEHGSAELAQRIDRASRGVGSNREHHTVDGRIILKLRNAMPDGGFVSTYQDITARKQAERALAEQARMLEQAMEELQRSNSELEQFAYVASHDLQEPLRMVASYCQLLQRRYAAKLDGDAHEFIGFAVEGAKRMQSLINDLLLYSRVGTKGKSFTATPLEQVLADALANLTVSLEEAKAVISHDPLPVVQGDEVQLLQLFQNLLGNALKFRSETPVRIHVASRREDDHWQISVSDNGIGIEPQYAERIFMIFQRLHTREQYPGTGIGLSVCKKIVERHGGRIWVEPAQPNGSVFKFTMPA